MSPIVCVVCHKNVDTCNTLTIHYGCYSKHKQEIKSFAQSINNKKIQIHSHIAKCIVCNKTLPPKSTSNIHKKCRNEKQKENKILIQVCRDKSECVVQY